MSKTNTVAEFEYYENELQEGVDLEDPFSYTKQKFVKKLLRESNIPFDIVKVKKEVNAKFGKPEWSLTVEYGPSDDRRDGIVNFSVGNVKGEKTKRDGAFEAIILGLKQGKKYTDYYLTGAASGMTLSKQRPL